MDRTGQDRTGPGNGGQAADSGQPGDRQHQVRAWSGRGRMAAGGPEGKQLRFGQVGTYRYQHSAEARYLGPACYLHKPVRKPIMVPGKCTLHATRQIQLPTSTSIHSARSVGARKEGRAWYLGWYRACTSVARASSTFQRKGRHSALTQLLKCLRSPAPLTGEAHLGTGDTPPSLFWLCGGPPSSLSLCPHLPLLVASGLPAREFCID